MGFYAAKNVHLPFLKKRPKLTLIIIDAVVNHYFSRKNVELCGALENAFLGFRIIFFECKFEQKGGGKATLFYFSKIEAC